MMSISYWLNESTQKPHRKNNTSNVYDYLVIGAGIAGLSTAYWLEKKFPQSQIAVLDKSTIGFGASGRNAGFMTCGSVLHFQKMHQQWGLSTAQSIWTFSEKNHQLLFEEIIQNDFKSVDYLKTGSCTVIPTDSDPEKFRSILNTMKNVGINVEMLTAMDLKKDYAVQSSEGGIEYRHDGVVHPIKLLDQIRKRLKSTDFILNEEVLSLQGGSNTIVTTSKNTYSGGRIFVCLNGYSGQLLPELALSVKPQRGQIIVTEPQAPMIKGPCYLTQHLCYFRQLPTGEILIGGFRNRDPENENTAQDQITEKIQNALEDFAQHYFLSAQNMKVKYRWSGIMGFTTDEQMMIGEHPQKKNIHLMAGCAGHGMGLSFHAAQNMVNESVPSYFDIRRFDF